MLNISVEEILRITDGKLVQGESIIINDISLDSRNIKSGEFFIAISGDNYDGHDFIVDAYKKGAIGSLVDITKLTVVKKIFNKQGYSDIPQDFIIIKVENALRSLGLIAAFYRRRFKVKTIAVTGSNGKTTTKELIYELLLTKYKKNEILKTDKNFNNEIGVPLTVFKMNSDIKVFVAELGINHIGEMQRLGNIVDPQYGVITNIGETHLEFLKNDRIVAKAKAELLPYIKDTLIFNFDDKYYSYFQNFGKCKMKGFSLNPELKVHDINVFDDYEDLGLDGFNVVYKGVQMKCNLMGRHNLYNLLTALIVADIFDVDMKKAKKVVEKFKFLDDRGNIIRNKNYTIFFDAYNANPTSVKSLLYFIGNLDFKTKYIILGDMMELGKKAMKHHTDVLNYAADFDFEKIFLFGKFYHRVYKERLADKKKFKPIKEFQRLAKDLKDKSRNMEKVIIFIKGSRAMEMENLLKFLK